MIKHLAIYHHRITMTILFQGFIVKDKGQKQLGLFFDNI